MKDGKARTPERLGSYLLICGTLFTSITGGCEQSDCVTRYLTPNLGQVAPRARPQRAGLSHYMCRPLEQVTVHLLLEFVLFHPPVNLQSTIQAPTPEDLRRHS